MNSMERNIGADQETTKTEIITSQVNSLMKDFPPAKCSEDELRKGERSLDSEMEKMSREELINLAADIREYLGQPQSGSSDESTYVRFGTVYGAACAQLEKLDEEKQ